MGFFEFTLNSVFLLFAGSEITVKAENINDPKTNNSAIVYEILIQKPQVSNSFSVHTGKEIYMITKDIGMITVQDHHLNASAMKHYQPLCSSSSPFEWL